MDYMQFLGYLLVNKIHHDYCQQHCAGSDVSAWQFPHNLSMATIVQNRELLGEIGVATGFDVGVTIRPIWVEQIVYPAEGRTFVTKANMTWNYYDGASKISVSR